MTIHIRLCGLQTSRGGSAIDFFFFNDTATTEIYTLSLHDALPIWLRRQRQRPVQRPPGHRGGFLGQRLRGRHVNVRSEEHTSELQSPCNLVCRLLLEKKKTTTRNNKNTPRNITHSWR